MALRKTTRIFAAALLFTVTGTLNAATILDFEVLPSGLTPTSFGQGSLTPTSSRVTTQFLNQGVVISNAAVTNLGAGHTASGTNGLSAITAGGYVDYDAVVSFAFFAPSDGSTKATTNYFAYSPDFGGGSGNTVTITAYGLNGSVVGSQSWIETGTFSSPLGLSGIGEFHSVTIDQTLYDTSSGGIAIDLVRYGDLSVSSQVPEPGTIALLTLGIVGLCATRRRKMMAQVQA